MTLGGAGLGFTSAEKRQLKARCFFPLSAHSVLLSLFKRSNEKKDWGKGVGVVSSDRSGYHRPLCFMKVKVEEPHPRLAPGGEAHNCQ